MFLVWGAACEIEWYGTQWKFQAVPQSFPPCPTCSLVRGLFSHWHWHRWHNICFVLAFIGLLFVSGSDLEKSLSVELIWVRKKEQLPSYLSCPCPPVIHRGQRADLGSVATRWGWHMRDCQAVSVCSSLTLTLVIQTFPHLSPLSFIPKFAIRSELKSTGTW